MKTINLFLISLLLTVFTDRTHAQEQLPYKSKAAFNQDTVQYLEYNYTVRRDQYFDKTVGEILKELEYPVLYVSTIHSIGGSTAPQLAGLYLIVRQMGNEPANELIDYYICIFFKNPPTGDEFREASGYSHDNKALTQKLYDFIKDLKVASVSSNQYIIMKRKYLEEKRMQEEAEKTKQVNTDETDK